MASTPAGDDVFAKLKLSQTAEEIQTREREATARFHAQYERQQARMAELVETTTSLILCH